LRRASAKSVTTSREARENADQRGLAGTVRTEQAEELARFDVETHIVQRMDCAARTAVRLADVLERDGCHGERSDCRQPPWFVLMGRGWP
jgi:hypothetical protein